jgi:hypothetical protein
MMSGRFIVILFFFVSNVSKLFACQCPITILGVEECDKYELIFKGKIKLVKTCGERYGEAVFELDELYKGNASKQFTVLFTCDDVCAQKFQEGEEWIVYTRYKQINNALMDWCSRSRKYFANSKEDFYAVTYGNDYYDELKFLREKLGLHRFIKKEMTAEEKRNRQPTKNQTIIMLICSLGAILLFYWLFNRYFKF